MSKNAFKTGNKGQKGSGSGGTLSILEMYNGKDKRRLYFLALAFISIIFCAIFSSLHYEKIMEGNSVTWISWVIAMLSVILAFLPLEKPGIFKKEFYINNRYHLMFFGFLTLLFFVSHFWNWSTAPWNHNGLFDDASWDIYFSEKVIRDGPYFQPAFPDPYAPREVIFHYYIIPFFEIFGYNLLVFNISLAILGYVTFIFMSLIIHRLFKNYKITLLCALAFNFLPLHFIHTFVGHRYAISAPLMLSSMYFLYTGFKKKSYFRIALSSVLTGLCVACATMGKQYLEALIGAAVFFLIFSFKKSVKKKNLSRVKLFAFGIIASSMPLIMYAAYNWKTYSTIESYYIDLFFSTIKEQGFEGFMTYFDRMKDCLFGTTYAKWFLPDYPLVPYAFWLLLVPGLFISFFKKHFHFPIIVLLASAGAFVAGYSDYRVLHSSPFWIILMAFAINEIFKLFSWAFRMLAGRINTENLPLISKTTALAVSAVVVLLGVIPSAAYIYKLSEDPFSVHHFNQKPVAVSRYIRDIVAGDPNPSTELKWQEFKKTKGLPEPDFDTLVCQDGGYAITHTFLYEYDDQKIMSLSDGMPANLFKSSDEVLTVNKKAIGEYNKTSKDLKLVWEVTPQTAPVIEKFKSLKYLGSDEEKDAEFFGKKFSLYVLNIKNENIDIFKEKASELSLY